MNKVTRNIDISQRLVNYWKVRTLISNSPKGAERTSAKWVNASFGVNLFNAYTDGRNVDSGLPLGVGDNQFRPFYEHIGHSDSIFSKEMYDDIHNVVTEVAAETYVQVDEGRIDLTTEVVCAIIQSSCTAYAMLCNLFRTQTGYLYKDEDRVNLGPIFFNHDTKGISTTDWNITSNNSFVEDIREVDLNTQTKIQNSGQVYGTWAIGNETWANLVSNVLAAIRLPKKVRILIEHLFTKVFVDPTKNATLSTVTLFPASAIRNINIDSDDADGNYVKLTIDTLSGYDQVYLRDNLVASTAEDNTATFSALVDYFDKFEASITAAFSYMPLLDNVFKKLGIQSGSDFNFTRDIKHATVDFVLTENIQDFIQSTAYNMENLEAYYYGDLFSNVAYCVPCTMRDEEEFRYGKALQFCDETNISLDCSFEYATKGRIKPLRAALYIGDNTSAPAYRYMYSIPCTTSGQFSLEQVLSVQYCNTDLADFAIIIPLQNDHYNAILASGRGAQEMSIIPTIRSYYTPRENLGLYAARAWDTFFDNSK